MKLTPVWKFLKDTGICKTTGEAKNEVRQRSIKINGDVMTEHHFIGLKENGEVVLCSIELQNDKPSVATGDAILMEAEKQINQTNSK